jgi:hypothetical protein
MIGHDLISLEKKLIALLPIAGPSISTLEQIVLSPVCRQVL